MNPLILWYSHDQDGDHVASTPTDVDAALDHVARLSTGMGALVEVTRDGDESTGLYAGFRGDVGVLYYGGPDGIVYSAGRATDGPSPASAVLTYDLQGNPTSFPPDAEVPVADVRAAVHEYARTGARPTGVAWQTWTAPREPTVGATRIM